MRVLHILIERANDVSELTPRENFFNTSDFLYASEKEETLA